MKISNIAELKTRRGATGSNVTVLGYYTSGDGGGGEFYWDNSSTTTDDGGTVIQVTGLGTGRWKRLYGEAINILWFGAKGDDSFNNTTIFQTAIDYAILKNHKQLYIPTGTYKITSSLTLSEGLMLIGDQSHGSTEGYCTTIKHYSNGDLFIWDGTGVSARGTGGGLRGGFLIVKADGFNGGVAVKILATSTSNRAGEMFYDSTLIYGLGTGTWAKGLFVDGTSANDIGTKGVRTIHLLKFRVAGCTESQKYIHLTQAVHFKGDGVQIDKGNGTGYEGITIDGESTNVFFSNSLLPYIYIDSTGTDVNFASTYAGQIYVNNSSVTGQFNGTIGDRIISYSKGFSFFTNYNPTLFAYLATTLSNVTGDGSQPTVIFDTTVVDKNTQYSSGVYTILVAGNYKVDSLLQLIGITTHTSCNGYIEHRNSVGTLINVYENIQWTDGTALPQRLVERNSAIINCNYNDTIRVKPYVAGGAKVVSILAGTSVGNIATSISINYIP
jgi:Pectate lyase superfamily protein